MKMNTVQFLFTISHNIRFGTAETILNWKFNNIAKSIVKVIGIYSMGCFLMQKIHANGQLEGISEKLHDLNIFVNVTSSNEHMPEAERLIRTIKERLRSTINTLSFKKIQDCSYRTATWLQPTFCTLVWSHVEFHEEHDNGMSEWTTGAFELWPTGNNQSGYYFYSMSTCKRLNTYKWTKLRRSDYERSCTGKWLSKFWSSREQ